MRFGLILLYAGLLAAQTQPAAQDTCRVAGTVLNSVTGQPVPRVIVTLLRTGFVPAPPGANPNDPPPSPAASTDAQGRFVFTAVTAGAYQIMARRDNFQYVPPRQSEPLTLSAGEQRTGLVVQVTPLGAIAGHVQNEEGDPLPRIPVNLMVYQYRPGGRQLVSRNSDVTNDLGDYRIFGLLSGKYLLRAAPMGGALAGVDETYVAMYYPGVSDPSGAAPVELAAGQDMRGVDFTLRRVHAMSVRGHVVKPAGAPNVNVILTAGNGAMGAGVAASAGIDQASNFVLRGVAPGAYTLTARTMAGNKMYTAQRPIQVGADDVEGMELTLAPPVDLNGVVRIDGNSTTKPTQLLISLQSSSQGARQARVTQDGTFTIDNLSPDVYRPTVYPPADLYMKAVRCGTADVTESGLDLTAGGGCDLAITLSANGGQVDGQVVDENGQPAQGAEVTLVADGARREDFSKLAGTDAGGHFKIAGVAPGSYRLYAWDTTLDVNAVRYDPDFLKPFESQGQSLQVSEGDKQTVSLKRIAAPAAQ